MPASLTLTSSLSGMPYFCSLISQGTTSIPQKIHMINVYWIHLNCIANKRRIRQTRQL
ncbi:hypothetical protein BD408DRAFT_413350 [Parasitella parasitica]|nr:hypothetical protein BD408DRAFT_413350 [Parasitella parasitica]